MRTRPLTQVSAHPCWGCWEAAPSSSPITHRNGVGVRKREVGTGSEALKGISVSIHQHQAGFLLTHQQVAYSLVPDGTGFASF